APRRSSGCSSGRRCQRRPPPPRETPKPRSGRTVTAKRPNHVWNIDLTELPTSGGCSTTWWPWRLPGGAPYSWWLVAVLDPFSRRVVGFAVFSRVPTADQVTAVLDRAVARVGCRPTYTVSDQGVHFRSSFGEWCARHGVKPRFGAVGKHGSIAVTERFFRALKAECLRGTLVPLRLDELCAQIARWCRWYDQARPHQGLGGRTPVEVYEQCLVPANRAPRLEPRARYPADSPCAGPQATVRGTRGARLKLVVDGFEGGAVRDLPTVGLRRAA
ncbi:MAG TPA: DDE-type integrase/transposase/recombinase, partial [Actinotalea sp.]|nr:DDE-type integrase/transposase/recombinase [Actinotalea sp.]